MKTAVTMLRAGALLAGFAAVGAGLLAGTYWLTRGPIEASAQARLLRELNAVLPPERYDNALSKDTVRVEDPRLGGAQTVYRARLGGQPAALILTATASEGYSGPIQLLIGIDLEGRITGVRVTQHRETPGLGDKVERRKSDWVLAFDGRSLDDPGDAGWAVRKDGGIFDQFAGATITPRAVVAAVHNALSWATEHQAQLFAETPESAPPPARERLVEPPA